MAVQGALRPQSRKSPSELFKGTFVKATAEVTDHPLVAGVPRLGACFGSIPRRSCWRRRSAYAAARALALSMY